MDAKMREKADLHLKKVEARRPEIEEKAEAMRNEFQSEDKRAHFRDVADRLTAKLKDRQNRTF